MKRHPRATLMTSVAVGVLALVAAGFALARRSHSSSQSSTKSTAGRWVFPDLGRGGSHSLVTAFNDGVGTPRVVLLVSPT
jgi:hypothetical protein